MKKTIKSGKQKNDKSERRKPSRRKKFLYLVDPRDEVKVAIRAYFNRIDPQENSMKSFKNFLNGRCDNPPSFQSKKPENVAELLIWAFPLRGNTIGPPINRNLD